MLTRWPPALQFPADRDGRLYIAARPVARQGELHHERAPLSSGPSRSSRMPPAARLSSRKSVFVGKQVHSRGISPMAARVRNSLKIGRLGDTFGGFGHPGRELASPGYVSRSENLAEVLNERVAGGRRERPGGAHLQPFDLCRPDPLVTGAHRLSVGTPARSPAAVVPAPLWCTTARQAGNTVP